jgi:hypothetical protein
MASFFDEALAFCPSSSSSRRRETVCIFYDDYSNPTDSLKPSLSTKPAIQNTITTSPAYTRKERSKPQVVQQRTPKISAASTRKGPLRRSSNPPQAGASAVDIPGAGGGKENIPPGMSAHNAKHKSIRRPLVYQTTRRTKQNVAPAINIERRAGAAREEPPAKTVIKEARGHHINVLKPHLQNTVVLNTQVSNWPKFRAFLQSNQNLQSSYIKAMLIGLVRQYWMFVGNVEEKKQWGRSAVLCEFICWRQFRLTHNGASWIIANPKLPALLNGPRVFPNCLGVESITPAPTALSSTVPHEPKRDQSAVIIQRAWRSYMEQKTKDECAIATFKIKRAKGVIVRWWRGINPSQKQEKTPRRKPAAQRSAGHQSRGRVGIRRL